MKNSTRNASSKRKVYKDLKGIIFFRKDLNPRVVTVGTWIAKGCPDGVYVYDELHALMAAGIPIVDAEEVRGTWIRLKVLKPTTPVEVRVVNKKEPKIVRASKLPLTESHALVLSQAETPTKIGTREIVC